MCSVTDFYLMVRELETSEVRKKLNIKEDLISLEKWGEIIERIQTLVSEDLSWVLAPPLTGLS